MLKKNEPDWIEHHLSPVCPVPAGHDVAVRYDWGERFRCDNPELRDWRRITHYCDWTAFEQQQASAEVPKLLTEAEWRELLARHTFRDFIPGLIADLRERGLIAPEPEPDALRDLAEELAAVKAREAKLRERAKHAEDGWTDTVNQLAQTRSETAALAERVKVLREAAFRAEQLLRRYRTETPLGYQPHMIAHQADEALSGILAALSEQQP